MRILADENIPNCAVEALGSRGHDVRWIRVSHPGIKDVEVLALASREHRLLLTFDKDFGELVFRRNSPAPYGIVLFRSLASRPDELAARISAVLESRDDWAGNLTVVERDRLRMIPLPRQ